MINMLNKLIKLIKDKREEELKKQKKQEYIQQRVMETKKEVYKNRKLIAETKQYFFDSNVYSGVFK